MILTMFQKCLGTCLDFRFFFIILGLWWGTLGPWMCGLASLKVDKIGWSGILDVGKNLGHPQDNYIHSSKVLEGIIFILGAFLVISRLRRMPLGSQKCGLVSLDMAEIGWCGRLSLGKNLGQPQNDFNHLLWCFWSFWALEGATGVTKMWCSLPECEWDRMYSQIGHG